MVMVESSGLLFVGNENDHGSTHGGNKWQEGGF
jgi:hypothetical protein